MADPKAATSATGAGSHLIEIWITIGYTIIAVSLFAVMKVSLFRMLLCFATSTATATIMLSFIANKDYSGC
jgi:hypothetical protein